MPEPSRAQCGAAATGARGMRGDPIAWEYLATLASRPDGEWTVFVDDDGEPLTFERADPVCIARLMGMCESAVGPKGVMGPTYHRITQKGRDMLAEHLAKPEVGRRP